MVWKQELAEQNETAPDLIFLYINMPVMNGVDFIEKLNQEQVDGSSVVLLTTTIKPEQINRCLNLGAKLYLNKVLNRDKVNLAVKLVRRFKKEGFSKAKNSNAGEGKSGLFGADLNRKPKRAFKQ
ncbi:MAG: response regulator [Flavobacteriales bacterium]|nr:response regulator [Flavobacteriales bacterium]